MLSRVAFVLIAAFWVIMNVLLWRTEDGSRHSGLGTLPAQLVWEKILTSPDSSSMSIVRYGKKVGFCRWMTSAGETWGSLTDATLPSGTPSNSPLYRLQFEGSVLLPQWTNRIRFEGSLKVDSHHEWQKIDARASLRLLNWQVQSVAREKTVTLICEDGDARVSQTFPYSDFKDPKRFLQQYAGPVLGGWLQELDSLGERFSGPDAENAASHADYFQPRLYAGWEACEETLRIGHAQVPVYRLQTRILGQNQISILVSRVGEILRVELPGQWLLVNDQLNIVL